MARTVRDLVGATSEASTAEVEEEAPLVVEAASSHRLGRLGRGLYQVNCT